VVSTNDLKNGMVLDLNGELWQGAWVQHHKPGKGNTVVRSKLKHVLSGKIIDKTFNSDTKVDTATIDRRDMQYLYLDGEDYVFMDNTTYDQIHISADVVGDARFYLLDNQTATVALHEGTPLFIELPASVELEVTYTEPGLQGDRSTGGTKPATLGHIRAHIAGSNVPDGFCIPFAYYRAMMDKLGINAATLAQIETQSGGDNRKRRTALLALQKKITDAEIPSEWKRTWAEQWRSQLNSKGVFVRSSSNSEDLPNFSGAGLYTTVPNVTGENALAEAVKQSWASVFNYSAYEARRIAGLPHDSVKMSVFVQQSINADLSGVLVTVNPYDTAQKNTSYIAAKRGLGIRVVEGKRVAEQAVYNRHNDAVQRLSSSNETTALQLDENGGVREVPITAGNVMNHDQTRRLDQAGQQIKQLFGNGEQDIEWAFAGGKLVILQARPYLNGGR